MRKLALLLSVFSGLILSSTVHAARPNSTRHRHFSVLKRNLRTIQDIQTEERIETGNMIFTPGGSDKLTTSTSSPQRSLQDITDEAETLGNHIQDFAKTISQENVIDYRVNKQFTNQEIHKIGLRHRHLLEMRATHPSLLTINPHPGLTAIHNNGMVKVNESKLADKSTFEANQWEQKLSGLSKQVWRNERAHRDHKADNEAKTNPPIELSTHIKDTP